jgi:8-oxo-dGTP pyrophosphatase MutT (NUDIX family)
MIEQAGVLAFWCDKVLLVNSRRRPNFWGIPKGVIEAGETPGATALREAYEEAGITGTLGELLGTYSYLKNDRDCTVQVFRMDVGDLTYEWPESFRLRLWCGIDDASRYCCAPLGELLRALRGSVDVSQGS